MPDHSDDKKPQKQRPTQEEFWREQRQRPNFEEENKAAREFLQRIIPVKKSDQKSD